VIDKVNLSEALSEVHSHWVPRVVGAYNDETVQVLKVQGEFVWHHHDGTDDLFLVLEGAVTVQLRDGDVEVGTGELFVVPRGVEHCLRAEAGASLLVVERPGDVDAGLVEGDVLTAPEGG
jgi:mannose-6-phosphate isomerase-like protein (cupin superfamily)